MIQRMSVILLIAFTTLACSRQYRESTPAVDSAQLNSLLEQVLLNLSPQAQGETESMIFGENYATLFYGEGQLNDEGVGFENMATPQSVFAFRQMDFIENGLEPDFIKAARVIFLANEQTQQFGLITEVDLSPIGEQVYGKSRITQYFWQSSEAQYKNQNFAMNDIFEVTLQNEQSGEVIHLKSFDVSKITGEFNATIQLEVYYEYHGEVYYEGKFSALTAFK